MARCRSYSVNIVVIRALYGKRNGGVCYMVYGFSPENTVARFGARPSAQVFCMRRKCKLKKLLNRRRTGGICACYCSCNARAWNEETLGTRIRIYQVRTNYFAMLIVYLCSPISIEARTYFQAQFNENLQGPPYALLPQTVCDSCPRW